MDLETFLKSCFSFLKSGDNMYFVLYALVTCLVTQVVKKLFVNKVNSDVLHKFDIASVLPYVFGCALAFVDVFYWHVSATGDTFGNVCRALVSGATIGALASAMFKFVKSFFGKSLDSMLSDDVFGAFYNQLLYFGNVREQLIGKELSLKDFISQVKLLSENARAIYASDADETEKYNKLHQLLQGVVSDENISACLAVLNKTLLSVTKSDKNK